MLISNFTSFYPVWQLLPTNHTSGQWENITNQSEEHIASSNLEAKGATHLNTTSSLEIRGNLRARQCATSLQDTDQ